MEQVERKTVDLWRQAAEQGFALAQNDLGDCYAKGHGVPQDCVEALKWYIIASEHAAIQGEEDSIPNRDRLAQQLNPEQIAEAKRRATQFVIPPLKKLNNFRRFCFA